LVRPAVAKVIEVVEQAETEGVDTPLPSLLKERTSLGSIYIEAMPRYAVGSGLLAGLSSKTKTLTEFGRQARVHDPHLNDLATQWLMHYYLSAPHGPGPSFWHYLITRRFRIGVELEGPQVAGDIATLVQEESGKPLAQNTARATSTIFLGTYAKSDGLGPLGFLRTVGDGRGSSYRVSNPSSPPLWALAYCLADYWEAAFGKSAEDQQVTTSLPQLTQLDGFTSLFFIGPEYFDSVLRRLQRKGLVEVYRVSPPYQVVRLWSDKQELLDHLYDGE